MGLESETTMLHAISLLGKAKAMKRTSKPLALIELIKGVSLMNKSIKMEPNNIENRKYRLRHLLGVTMHSPKSFIKEVEDDLSFFQEQIGSLTLEDRAYYLSALGEYEFFRGNKERGIEVLTDVINNYPDSTIYEYSKLYLESIIDK
ncbi:hypothetical protein EW093_14395 [Thiospirochaeta perfilievii]|uniref:Tetratricopeptide repeat protein n=1 Tax=Thiospirochaeta perfilievii TaxID=252967 RepID=A0A5C1QFK5_9SPIO|nr:hypothetical protein [Thiospirochaeta perfilievii]QEN05839.1 hypothetical protein EW093_14395 [Thiospirochaeta perfilievii]